MSQSIGKQLMEARKKKGLTLEDVSFKTRIPLSRLNELENDDFSNFANLTYAKSFLRLYSEHLGLDIGAYLSEWDTKELAHVYGRQYMQSGTTGVGALSVAPAPFRSRIERPRGSTRTPWWLLILALGGLIALPIWLMKNKGGEESADDAPRKPRSNPTSTSPSGSTSPSTPAGTTPTTPTDTKRPEPVSEPTPPPNSTAPATTVPATTPPLPANEPNSGSPPKARPVGEGVLPTQPEKNPGDVVPKIEDLPAPATPDASPPKPRIIPG